MSIKRFRVSNRHSLPLKMKKFLELLVILLILLAACNFSGHEKLIYRSGSIQASRLSWSPNENLVAITTNKGNPPESSIYFLDIKTGKTDMEVSQNFGHIYGQNWTPDAKRFIFSGFSNEDSSNGTWTIELEKNSSPEKISNDAVLAWSPSNELLLFRRDNSNDEISLFLRGFQSNEEHEIFSTKGKTIVNANWSSDGSKLVFLVEKDFSGNNAIYIYDSNTQKITQVNSDSKVMDPSLSPNGEMIAYRNNDNKNILVHDTLHIMKSNGNCDVEIPGHLNVFSPVWSPKGTQIAYINQGDGGIYLLDLEKVYGNDFINSGIPCP